MNLVHKMTGLLLLSACGVLGVYGYLSVEQDREMFEAAVIQDGLLIAHTMRVSCTDAWRSGGREAAERVLGDASASEDELTFRLEPAPSTGDVAEGREQVEVVPGAPSLLRIMVPLELPEQSLALVVEESLQKEDTHLARTKLRIGAATLALILVSGLVAFLIGNRLVGGPMRELMDKADRVGKGDLTGPLELTQSDEIGQLAEHMNLMCENLARETEERRTAQDQLRHAERLATVGELAAGIAHELGTPLNVVLGRAMLLSSEFPEARDNVKIIVEQTERMIGIIRQLLDFARRGTSHKTLRDLRDVVSGLVDLLDPLASEANVQLRADLPEREVPASVDPVQIQQALTNVTVNAIQASPPGSEVWIRARHDADGVSLVVEDQGPGLSESQRVRVFEPFFTTKEVGFGTGLGLPVAHGIVTDHGGRIEVESTPGRGSRFVLHLPAAGVGVGVKA